MPLTDECVAMRVSLDQARAMARNTYDQQTAAGYKSVREIPRDGLLEWRDAVQRHFSGETLLDLGAGTGQFATAFLAWFDFDVIAVEPSAAMRAQIPSEVRALPGDASAIPLPDGSVDGAWISLVLHHIPDLEAAAREIRRVLRHGAPVMIRGGVAPTQPDRIENVRWFPETAGMIAAYPSIDETCAIFATAGFERHTRARVRDAARNARGLSRAGRHVALCRHDDSRSQRRRVRARQGTHPPCGRRVTRRCARELPRLPRARLEA
jgi:ubiquinone/menaquinone biosynthesis C-methylase UbiE